MWNAPIRPRRQSASRRPTQPNIRQSFAGAYLETLNALPVMIVPVGSLGRENHRRIGDLFGTDAPSGRDEIEVADAVQLL